MKASGQDIGTVEDRSGKRGKINGERRMESETDYQTQDREKPRKVMTFMDRTGLSVRISRHRTERSVRNFQTTDREEGPRPPEKGQGRETGLLRDRTGGRRIRTTSDRT